MYFWVIMSELLSKKQAQYIKEANAKWNLCYGSVRCGKTVGSIFKFMLDCLECPDSNIYIVGHTFDTAYRNVVRAVTEHPQFAVFQPFLNWSGKKLYYRDKIITVLGAKDEGAVGNFQGDTHSLTYCDEITLYPDSIIDMIDTRLSNSWSKAHATMNPTYPTHKVKGWIDEAAKGNKDYYQLHFTLDDNPYVDEEYKNRIKNSLSGVFYKRNYLGLWCLAEGAIFDFFDRALHVSRKPPCAAEYYIAAIDYGASNPFACLLIGVSTGRYTQEGKKLWVEKEYYWDPKKTQRSKTNSEFARDVYDFLEPYNISALYIDPSAAAFKQDLRRIGLVPIDANNEVLDGIQMTCSEMQKGNLTVMDCCHNLIRELETYVWDKKAAEKGDDVPKKANDHAVDALRYAIATHKVSVYQPYKHKEIAEEWRRNKYDHYRK
jgi:PBSX family phage terminase large subunit